MALSHALRCLMIVICALALAPAVVVASFSQECDATCPADLLLASQTSIYSGGAAAQTYKAGAPIKTTICDTDYESKQKTKYRVARWPLSRRSYPTPPVVKIVGKIHSCNVADTCASNPADSGNSGPITVEAWQARPDGTYSSLRSGVEEGECRSAVAVSNDSSSFQVETLAPGSVGMFSGIGPRGVDLPPYGPPVVNFFIQSQGHAPLLVNIPVSAKSFYGPDLRRPVIIGSRSGGSGAASAQISSWNVEDNGDISLSIDFFLTTRSSDDSVDHDSTSLSDIFCNSAWFHGSTKSFFVEPIAVCAPSALDFFEL